jgi:diguanylate cyclase (GGDEF)-like protein
MAILDTLPGQVGLIDGAGDVVYANRPWLESAHASVSAARRPGLGGNYLNQCTLLATRGDEHASTMLAGMLDVISGTTGSFSMDYPNHDDNGPQWCNVHVAPLPGHPDRFVVAHEDVTARIVAERQVADQARALDDAVTADGLTGLLNRQGLSQWLQREARRCDRYDDIFSIGLIEIDHFKTINASFGQRRGDDVIVRTGRLLLEGSRASDTIGRWSGHVFLAVLPGTNIRGAWQTCEKIRSRILAAPMLPDRQLTISYGIVEYEPGFSIDELIACADLALYRARRNGRNRGAVGILGPEAVAVESV